MADLPSNVRFTWQLVSQFVSWEFCKYMSENKENNNSETDVLGYLRSMIVQRTEKSISDVTKHEIIAKFIMEIKANSNFQVSSIVSLSESVKRICPELNTAVDKLVHHLETFFDIIESTDESAKTAIVQARIEDAISDFSKEASRLLPEPDLIQIVDSWSGIHHHHNHPHPHSESPKKSVYNPELFEKVLECLHFEGMTPSEARIIAVALNDDKVFEKILRNAEAEPEVNNHFTQVLENFHYTKVYENILRNVLVGPETEADSEIINSQSSQPVYSQEFMKNTQATKASVNPFNHQSPPNLIAHSQAPLVDDNSLQLSDGSSVPSNGLDLPQNDDPPDMLVGTPPSPPPSPKDYPFIHRDQSEDVDLQKSTSHIQFAQSSANESDEGDEDLQDRIQAKFQQIHETEMRQNKSDVDTSDCDLDPDIRFLTPTYFKKGENHVIYVSDVESNDSSIITNVPGSQQTDPSWSRHRSILPATQYVRPNKRKKKKNSPVKKQKTNLPVKRRAPARRRLPSSDSEESLVNPVPSKPPYYSSACSIDELRSPHLISVSADNTIDEHRTPQIISISPDCTLDELRSPHLISTSAVSTRAQLGSPHRPSTSATRTRAELGGPLKRRKMTKALYRSPTLCIDEFISTLRKPNSDTLSEVSVPNVTTAKKAKNTAPSGSNTLKKQKCKQCNKTYKTTIALRRHVFLKHTDPPEDSDCDT